jgi:predicted RNase H-like nuclease (RuvC/YqgF family)
LSLTQNPIFKFAVGARRRTIMKLKKLRRKIQELEKRLREDPEKLARLKRKLQQAESAKALKAARKSAARATASRKPPKSTAAAKKPGGVKKAKKKLNLSPERRAQLSAAMKARWAAKRAAAGSNTSSTNQNSPTPPVQAPENRGDGI